MSQMLTEKQMFFAGEFVKDMNISATAKRCKIKAQSAREMLKKPHISEYINRLIQKDTAAPEVAVKRVLQELMYIAFFDPIRLFSETGQPLPLSEIDEGTRRCIAGVEFSVEGRGKDAEIIKKYKIIDKHKALENLGRHLAMFTDRIKVDVPTELDRMSDEQLRDTVKRLAEATGFDLGSAETAETQH